MLFLASFISFPFVLFQSLFTLNRLPLLIENFLMNILRSRVYILIDKIDVHICLFSLSSIKLQLRDLLIHQSYLPLNTDCILNAPLNHRLELAPHIPRRTEILFHLFALFSHHSLLGEGGGEVEHAAGDREELAVDGLWLPQIFVHFKLGLLSAE